MTSAGRLGLAGFLAPQARDEMVGPWHLMASIGHGGADHLDDPAEAGTLDHGVIRSFRDTHLPDGLRAAQCLSSQSSWGLQPD